MTDIPPEGRGRGKSMLMLLVLILLVALLVGWAWLKNPPGTSAPASTGSPPALPPGGAPTG